MAGAESAKRFRSLFFYTVRRAKNIRRFTEFLDLLHDEFTFIPPPHPNPLPVGEGVNILQAGCDTDQVNPVSNVNRIGAAGFGLHAIMAEEIILDLHEGTRSET